MTNKIDAYWFAAGDTLPNGDGRRIVVGKTHSLRGEIVICGHALHASRHPFDALQYAPGLYLYKVRVWGDVQEQDDKLGARHREYVARRDATDMLRRFARECALDVIYLWDAPQVVRDYLTTGDETLREAAAEAAAEAYTTAAAYAAAAAAYAAYAAAAAAYAARLAARAARLAARAAAARAAAARAAAARSADVVVRSADVVARSTQRDRFAAMVDELFSMEG